MTVTCSDCNRLIDPEKPPYFASLCGDCFKKFKQTFVSLESYLKLKREKHA